MRSVCLLLLAASGAFAAGPPPDIRVYVRALSSADWATRKKALDALSAMDQDAVPLLRRADRPGLQVDTRLGLYAAAGAIRARSWALIKAFGPGKDLPAPPVPGAYPLHRVLFSADGKHAIAGGGALIAYDLATGKETARVMEDGATRSALDVSADGKHALTGHSTATAFHLVSLPGLKTVKTFDGHTSPVAFVNLSPDGKHAASIGYDTTLRVWSLATGKELRRLDHHLAPTCLAFSPDGKEIVLGVSTGVSHTQCLWVYGTHTGKVRKLTHPSATFTSAAWLPGGRIAASTSDGFVRVLRAADGREVMKLRHGGAVNEVAVSPDGLRAASAGVGPGQVKVWCLKEGVMLWSFDGHVTAPLAIAFSRDGRQLLTSDAVGCLRLWKVGRR